MNYENETNIRISPRLKKVLMIVLLVFSYIAFVKYIFPQTWPIIIGFIIAKIIAPVVSFLKKHLKIADGFASAIVLTIVTGVICGVLVLAGVGIYNFAHGIIVNRDRYEQVVYNYCDEVFYEVEETFDISHGVLMERSTELLESGMDKLTGTIVEQTMGNSAGMLKSVINICIAGVVLYACTVLLAKDMNYFTARMKSSGLGAGVLGVYDNVKGVIVAYVKAQLLIMIVNAVICSVALMLLKIPNSIIIGIIVGFLDALPMIGVGVIFIPWSIVCLLLGKYIMAVVLFLVFVVCSIVRELLEPKLMGSKIGIHPVATLGAIFVGYNLFGIIGFVLGPIGFIIIKNVYGAIILDKKSFLE